MRYLSYHSNNVTSNFRFIIVKIVAFYHYNCRPGFFLPVTDIANHQTGKPAYCSKLLGIENVRSSLPWTPVREFSVQSLKLSFPITYFFLFNNSAFEKKNVPGLLKFRIHVIYFQFEHGYFK